jgi:glycosyltransferase involved in cell wall biosynthesis
LRGYEKEVSQDMDKCFAVSEFLVNNIKSYNRDTELLLPGHSFDLDYSLLLSKKEKGRMINIGYMGYINDRLRLDWLSTVDEEIDLKLHLIGPNENDKKYSKVHFENSIFAGSLLERELQEYLCNLDVLVMPYVEREAMATQAPNKLFLYIASLKPIVTSPMPNLVSLPKGCIYTAKNKRDFIEKIRFAFNEDSNELIQNRFNVAKENQWVDRKTQLIKEF